MKTTDRKRLVSYKDIATIDLGYEYVSPKKKVTYLWVFCFGLLTGDLNPIHVNFLTASAYRSKLGGLAQHGIGTSAKARGFVFKILHFDEPTEILATRDTTEYLRPVTIGDTVAYTYILKKKMINDRKKIAACTWEITARNQNSNVVCKIEWDILYCAIDENIVKSNISHVSLFFPGMEIAGTPIRVRLTKLFLFACSCAFLMIYARGC